MTKEERMDAARGLHKQGCNCCQAVVMAWADKLPIDKNHAMNVAAPFGRGLAGTREVCGCVSGMAMVCGLTGNTEMVRPLIEKFREDNGDIVCARLLQMGKRPCPEMVAYAAGLLAENLYD
ncbi:MAG: C_GCAxxG_C_C family protein [Bacteroidales bacterium]|nr:C_GCAxxG_C_C family protein [Bacteroidales bacterium]